MPEIVRSITHWTAGGGRASATDKEHYHRITEYDGKVVDGLEEIEDNLVTSDGDYAAHTLRLNTGSAGFAMAGMRGAVEYPFNSGPSPINRDQFEAHCKMLAEFHQAYGIPVTGKTCLTHAEVEPTLGVKQRGKWDLTRLPFEPGIRGAVAVGDYMRERVRSYMTGDFLDRGRPILRPGDRGTFVLDMQELLSHAGFFSGNRDGVYGPRTKAAVVSFQDANALHADGIVGANTWAALMKPKKLPDRHVTENDLRERGSKTIEVADKAETGAKQAAAAVVGLSMVDTSIDVADKLGEAHTALGLAQEVLLTNWPVLCLIGIGLAVWKYGPSMMAQVRKTRTEDAQTGANLKR